ncbi:MAG: hypothetical protein QM635_11635 [Microbacteriaceae bacterium]
MPSSALSPAAAVPAADDRAAVVAGLRSRIRSMQAPPIAEPSLPTATEIAALLPGRGLRKGASYVVDSSLALAMALIGPPSAAGRWCGVVGVPELGVEAAAALGVDLARLALVPEPGEQWLAVTATLAEVLDLVVLRPGGPAGDAAIGRLGARLRRNGTTLIALGPWPQAEATLRIVDGSWSGIGNGHGHLEARRVTVAVGAAASGPPRTARLWLPAAVRA